VSLEVAAVSAGKAVGRLVVGAWLADRSAAQERQAELTDLIQARFPDRLVRRRFERQVADIADQVAERLLRLCGAEYGGLRGNDQEAALAAVVQALAGADLSDAALFAADVDAAQVAARVRAGLPRGGLAGDLGEAGARLYDVVLDECCDCLVRIVRQLPQFGPRAAAVTLARLSALADQVALVLERVPVRTLDAPEGTATDAEFRRRYAEHVSVTLDSLELFGVRVERYRPRTTLSVAYISLSVSAEAGPGSGRRSGARADIPQLDQWHADGREAREATLRVETALGRAARTLIRGEAGSGKSTLLRWLAISAARGTFTGDLAGWNGCVPFLVKLRSHGGAPLPPPERFLGGVADPLAGLMPAGWVHRQLASGRALLLVDGVDELPSGQRRAIRPWLAGLLAAYPAISVVVTSRPAAAGADWLSADGFATAFLERMTPADVRELVAHWHAAIRDAGDLPCAAEDLPGFEAALMARLEAAPHLRALAGSPLLAAMLCALNLDREKQLPRDRMGLYAAALDLLLERRDVERNIQSDDGVALERAQKVQVLQDLAWRLSVTGRTELPKDAVIRWTGDKLRTMTGSPPDGAAAVEYLLQRSGVLREPVAGRIDFVHRTVQEYLTARQFADDGDLEPLISAAHRDQWRETIIMAAGHANAPQRAELLSGLLRRIAAEPRQARQISLLVAGCLETLPAIPAELRADVDARVDALIPPRDLSSARSLAGAGPPVLDRLPRGPAGLSAAQARAVIRTAWLINGPEALDLISGYGADARREVQDELITAWEYFDPDAYARRVLAGTPLHAGVLTVSQARLLPAARHVTQARSLFCLDAVPDLAWLRGLGQPITQLSVYAPLSGDFSPLAACAESLRELEIFSHGPVSQGLAPLRRLRNLARLTLAASSMPDIGILGELPELDGLYLTGLAEVTDFSPLQAQRGLAALTLQGAAGLTTAAALPPLRRVTELGLGQAGLAAAELPEIVARAPGLTCLRANHSALADDLAPLLGLPLRQLSVWACDGIRDFAPLAGMRDLEYLDLDSTRISDLAPLAGLSRLEDLWLLNCPAVTDLAPLAALPRLRRVRIGGIAPGTDLAPLASSRAEVSVRPGQELRSRAALGRRLKEIDS
jgi:hypothetical protein